MGGMKKHSKLFDVLLIAGIVVAAVALYFLMPALYRFAARVTQGVQGLLLLFAVAALVSVPFFFRGYRKKRFVYVLLLLLFIALMIWLYFNYRALDSFLSARFGQLAATVVFLLIIAAVWLISRFLL